MLDLGPTFGLESERLDSLLEDRDQIVQGRIQLGVPFLDDCIGGVYPRDLLLVGAATGVGKTELAITAAEAGAQSGRKTYLFALEAETGEVSARLYYRELGRLVRDQRMDFGGWWRGHYKHYDEKYGAQIRETLRPRLENLHTLYKKRGDFTPQTLAKQLEAIATEAGMVVLDHVHEIDQDGSRNNAQIHTVNLLRDMALDSGIPVVAISHLRKKQAGQYGTLVPEIDELHGASELSKVATQVVMVARDWDAPRPKPHLSPTLMRVPKDRKGRSSTLVARVYYDLAEARYESAYELGRLAWENRRQVWQLLEDSKLPHWAEREARKLTGGDIPI